MKEKPGRSPEEEVAESYQNYLGDLEFVEDEIHGAIKSGKETDLQKAKKSFQSTKEKVEKLLNSHGGYLTEEQGINLARKITDLEKVLSVIKKQAIPDT